MADSSWLIAGDRRSSGKTIRYKPLALTTVLIGRAIKSRWRIAYGAWFVVRPLSPSMSHELICHALFKTALASDLRLVLPSVHPSRPLAAAKPVQHCQCRHVWESRSLIMYDRVSG